MNSECGCERLHANKALLYFCFLSHLHSPAGKRMENCGFSICSFFFSPSVHVFLTVLLFNASYRGYEPQWRPHCPSQKLLVLSKFSRDGHPPLQMLLMQPAAVLQTPFILVTLIHFRDTCLDNHYLSP